LGIVEGVNFLYESGIIHCDIKDDNILVKEDKNCCLSVFKITKK
jgi:serine/threonine protein kinase